MGNSEIQEEMDVPTIVEVTSRVHGQGKFLYWYTSQDPTRSTLVKGDSEEQAQRNLLEAAPSPQDRQLEIDLIGHFERIGEVMETTVIIED